MVERLWLEGKTYRAIAAAVKLSKSTVATEIQQFRADWAAERTLELVDDLERIAAVEREAWRRYRADGKPEHIADVRWAIEQRAKLAGHYAPTKLTLRHQGEVRVAGRTIDQYAAETDALLQAEAERILREYGTS